MSYSERYQKDENGNTIRDGVNLSQKKAPYVDVEVFMQEQYRIAVKRQNNAASSKVSKIKKWLMNILK